MDKRLKFLIFGQLFFIIGFSGFLINYFFLDNHPALAFVTGLLFGLSLVLNLAYLTGKYNRQRRSDRNESKN